MADEEAKVEATEEVEANEKPKKSKLVLILIVILVILLGVVGFLGYKFLLAEEEPTEEGQETIEQSISKKEKTSSSSEEINLSEAFIYSLDEFISNIASDDGSSSNFIKLKIDLVFNQSEVPEAILEKFNSYFSDIVLTTVSEKNFEFLNTYSGKNELKLELKDKFNQLFSQIEEDIEVNKILFKSFVIQ